MYYKAISLDDYQYCATQPYLSGDYQVDLLLRNHNWAGAVNTSVELSYKVVMNPSRADLYKGDYWSNEGLELSLSLNYLNNYLYIESDTTEYITSYIDNSDNRDSYHIYENNFESSFKQTEYILSVILENIKRKLIANPNHPDLEKYYWIKDVEFIYQLDTKRLAISEDDLYRNHHDMILPAIETVAIDANLTLSKLNAIVEYVFNQMSEVANIKFKYQDAGEKITILAKASASYKENGDEKDDYFSLERFDYSLGKTHHVQLEGKFYLSDSDEALKKVSFESSLHGIGHMLIDHPNDANIAIRESIFPTDYKWDLNQDYGISDEYRADNGCMSVMAFTKCFYQGIAFHDVLTFMPIDIKYLQHVYGKNELTRSNDTTYILASNQTYINEIENPMLPIDLSEQYHQEDVKDENNFSIHKQVHHHVIYSLYDAGGINNFDVSLVENAKIDLNQGAGHFNVIGDNFFIIAYDVDIHNVIIGSGEIEIKLNDLANNVTIPSRGAHVKIEGFSSNDRIIFEESVNDILEFSGCIYPYSNAGDNDTELCFI